MPRASCKESVPCRPTRPSSSSTGCRRPSASGWGAAGRGGGVRDRRHRRGLARQGDALRQVRARGPHVPADLDLSPDDRRRLCRHGHRQPVERVGHGAAARLCRGDGEPLGGRRDAAGDPQRRGPLRAADRGGAAERAEAGGRALRGGGLAAGGGAGDGVLPDQAEPQPERADRAAGRADRAADGDRGRPTR